MGILENAGMFTAGSNQYLQPDYISPSTVDSKKSPLALLALTCSQIGADSSKPLNSDKKKEGDDVKKEKRRTPIPVEATRRSPAFKPYENTTSKEGNISSDSEEKANCIASPTRYANNIRTHSNSSSSSDRAERTREEGCGRTSREGRATSTASTSPTIRSGLEVLAGYPKDLPLGTYRAALPQSLLPPGYPGLENHPAFRGAHPALLASLYPTSLSSVYQSQAAAAALYSSAGLSVPRMTPSPMCSHYLSYTQVKVSGGGETVVPVCRNPYCTGCAYSLQNNHLLQSNGACPLSCTQCEQAKAALRAMPGLSSLPASSIIPASSLLPPNGSAASSLSLSGPPKPHVCNWAPAGDAYCGKRFASAEELLQHLRSHTSSAISADSSNALALSGLLSNPLQAHAALLAAGHRPGLPYPPGAISPLAAAAAARYHPYAKPASALSALPPTHPGLSPYHPLSAYSPSLASLYPGLYPRLSL